MLRNPKTFNKRLDNKAGLKEENKFFYFLFEGKKTEKQYFNGNNKKELNIDNQINIKFLEREKEFENVSHPLKNAQALKTFINKIKNYEEFNEQLDEIFLIFDRDMESLSEKQFKKILYLAKNSNFKIGLTNPCFEFWLFLHIKDINKYDKKKLLKNEKINNRKNSRRYISKILSDVFNGYSKTRLNFKKIKDKINIAIENEKKFEQDIEKIFSDLGSNIGIIIQKLKE